MSAEKSRNMQQQQRQQQWEQKPTGIFCGIDNANDNDPCCMTVEK